MPYVSDKQRRFFHTDAARKKGITPEMVAEYDEASRGQKHAARALPGLPTIPKPPLPPKPPGLHAQGAGIQPIKASLPGRSSETGGLNATLRKETVSAAGSTLTST